MLMNTFLKYRQIQAILFWIALITSWLLFLLFFTLPLAFLFWTGVLLYLFLSRTKLKWYLLLLSSWTLVPLYGFLAGTNDYFQGQATIKTYGLPGPEFWNLHPQFRAWRSTSGCVVMGDEIFTQTPNNIAVKFWTKLLGPQPHVYQGYYPSKQETDSLLRIGGARVKYERSDQTIAFNFNGESIQIENKLNEHRIIMLHRQLVSGGLSNSDKIDSANVLIFNNECIIFQPIWDTLKLQTILADRNTGKAFARYFTYQTR